MKRIILTIIAVLLLAGNTFAAEVENLDVKQLGNRVLIEYDIVGDEDETEITVLVTAGGKDYTADSLHLGGDYGKVKAGKGKKIYWNVLQDIPRGLSDEVTVEVLAGGKEFKDTATGMEFIFVKGGCYQMGDTFGDGESDEKPVHEVCVDDFYMGKYEVMQGEWEKVIGNNPSYFKNCGDNCPVEQVSWNDIQDFIGKLNEFPLNKGGLRGLYRLPTEAEWEYAARSGGKREKYAGGDYVDSVAWYDSNSGKKTHPVGTKSPNGLGIYDMSGNVWEWVQDWYGEKYYSESPRNNPKGPYSGQARVLRGGSWYRVDRHTRSASRGRGNPVIMNLNYGFRLVRTK